MLRISMKKNDPCQKIRPGTARSRIFPHISWKQDSEAGYFRIFPLTSNYFRSVPVVSPHFRLEFTGIVQEIPIGILLPFSDILPDGSHRIPMELYGMRRKKPSFPWVPVGSEVRNVRPGYERSLPSYCFDKKNSRY